MKEKILFTLTFLFFSLGQLGRFSLIRSDINFYAYEIFLGLTLFSFILKFRLDPLKNRLSRLILLLLGYLLFSWTIAIFRYPLIRNLISLLYLLRLSIYFLFFLYVFYWFSQTKNLIRYIQIMVVCFILFTILTGFLQYFFYPDLQNLYYLGWDPHLYRIFGVFFEPAVASAVYGLLIFYLILNQEIIPNRYFRFSVVGILGIMLLLTYGRSAYLGLLITLLAFAIQKHYLKQIIIVASLFILTIVFLPKKFGEGVNLLRTSTITSRIADYQEGLKVWLKSPIFGIGYNHIREEKREVVEDKTLIDISHSGASFHSSFLVILATGGIIGLIFYWYILKNLFTINRVAFYGGIYLSILSLFDNIFLHPFLLFLYFILVSSAIRPYGKSP